MINYMLHLMNISTLGPEITDWTVMNRLKCLILLSLGTV